MYRLAILKMYYWICFLLLCTGLAAQDKLILKNGDIKYVKIKRINETLVMYNDSASENPNIQHFEKKEIALIEKADGTLLLFPDANFSSQKQWELEPDSTMTNWRKRERLQGNHLIGTQPLGLVLGRLMLNYEYLFANKTIGIMLPLSLTFNPYSDNQPSSVTGSVSLRTYSWIYGADVNFYFTKKPHNKFFIGPRLRFGEDLLIGLSAGTAQIQTGWMLGTPKQHLMHHVSFGFGIVKIYNNGAFQNQLIPWMSINYRISLRLPFLSKAAIKR